MTLPRAPQRAHGRSLSDFPNLNAAEKKLLAAVRAGEIANFGDKVPETEAEKKDRTIRAGLVRFLALGGDDDNPMHEVGAWIRGAVIGGLLDLHNCTLTVNLGLWNCDVADDVILQGARLRTLNLTGSRCTGIAGDRLHASGSIFLREGFVARGAVRLLGAQIGGDLSCIGGRFAGTDEHGNTLACDRIDVGGDVFLKGGFVTRGAVRLPGATIGGNLSCSGGLFEETDKGGHAFVCDRIDVGGSVFLHDGFVARGAVRFLGAKIGGDVVCSDGRFGGIGEDAAGEADAEGKKNRVKKRAPVPDALILARATVNGTLWLVGGKTRFHGGADLTGSHIRRIVDNGSRTTRRREPDPSPQGDGPAPCFLRLDGLTYDRFGEDTDLSADARIAFLRLQHPVDLEKNFKPQPWMQMAKVLRETGHADAAREVAIAYEEARRSAGVIRSRTARLLHWFYGWLVGYGHRLMRLLKITSLVWFACAVIYENAAQNGWMAPTQSIYFQHERYDKCRPEKGGNWTTCDVSAPEYTTFSPYTYSLDVLLPLVDLQQQDSWAPIVDKGKAPIGTPWGVTVRFVMWFEVLFGWLASLLLAAVVTGLAKRSDGSG